VEEELAVHYGDPWFDNGFVDYLKTRCHSDYCSESIFCDGLQVMWKEPVVMLVLQGGPNTVTRST
jgi:hypothetical protein